MADLSQFKDPEFWATRTDMDAALAEFAAEVEQAITNAGRFHENIEVVGEGRYLRHRADNVIPAITDSFPPEGEGDWVLPNEDHVGEDTV